MKETLKGKETKQKILDCALELFVARGYAGTSMNDIIQQLGISKGSVYWHFKSKEDIFMQVITESYDQWLSLVDEELACITDPIEKLRRYSQLFIKTVDIPVWRISPETYWNEFDNRNSIILDTLFAQDDILLLKIFQEGISKDLFIFSDPADAEKLTWVYINCLEGMFEKIILSYKNVDPLTAPAKDDSPVAAKYAAELEKHMEYSLFAIDLFLDSITK